MTDDDVRTVRLAEVRSVPDLTALDPPLPSVEEPRWQPVNLAGLPERPAVEPTLGGLGIAYPGARHVFSGPQESAKTLAAYILGLELLRLGGVFCLIDFEMGRWDARNRLRELSATDEELAQIVYFEPEGRMPESVVPLVIERVGDREGLVVIDASAGAFAFEELDDNKRMDVEKFGAIYVEPFRKASIASVVIDHVVKSTEARGNYAIGSERKVGATDVHLGFTVVHPIKRGGHGTYKVTTHKDRGGFFKRGKLADFELVSDPETHKIAWAFKPATEVDEEHPFRPTVKMEQASKWLEKQLEEDVPMSHIENGIGGDREAGRLAIQLLVDEGYFRERSGARNARLMTLVRPYREEFDDHLSTSPLTSPHLSGEVDENDLSGSPPPYRGGEVGEDVSRSGEVEEKPLFGNDDIPF